MRRQVCWFERCEDGVKREFRVSVSTRTCRWQCKRTDEERWTYDAPATPEQWEQLEHTVSARYQRRAAPYKDLELVRQLRSRAADEGPGVDASPPGVGALHLTAQRASPSGQRTLREPQ